MIDRSISKHATRVVLTILLIWGSALPVALAAPSLGDAQKPNVVYIISDDQAFGDYGFMGNRHVHTPNIDALAARSARYINGYVPSSVCRPSLATMLTGLYPHQHGVYFNHPPPGFRGLSQMETPDEYYRARQAAVDYFKQFPTLPTILRKADYVSFQAGKHWEGTYRDAAFDEGMTVNRPCFDQPWNRQLPGGEWVAHGNGDAGLIIGRKTMQPVFDFVDRNADRPFLLWYAPVLPHEPHDAPAKYRERFESNPHVPQRMVGYYANIAWFDDTVGQLLDHLDGKGLTKNTLFVYVCDNGWTTQTNSPKQDKRSKRSPFENGIRTPILLRWDGIIQPATHEALVSSIDLVPTVLSALGVARTPYQLPGVDLMPSARGEEPLDADRPVFGEIYPGDAMSLGKPERDIAYRWVRDGNLKLIVPHASESGKAWNRYVDRITLYDLASDPGETKNLADDPKSIDHVSRLQKLLDDWWPARR